ncbi:hypothetical protein ASG46_00310 [Bacillus sp. Leaf49]|nr:hypothetical protein ASG46_00310 [Bacillus sp. Leaf49]MCS3483188.1 hypothetical protein [Bacillus sp. JUb11]MDI6661062.1 hypothetical protein [Bacillus altitudinis]GJI57994.1 hypothetical protein BATMR_10220 [Bacillus altitudinis]
MELKNIFVLKVLDRFTCGKWDHYPTAEETKQALLKQFGSYTQLGSTPITFVVIKQQTFYQGDIQDLQEGF